MRILCLCKSSELVLESSNNDLPLLFVAILDQRLQDTTSIMLVTEFLKLLSDNLDALLHDFDLLGSFKFKLSLFENKFVVVDS